MKIKKQITQTSSTFAESKFGVLFPDFIDHISETLIWVENQYEQDPNFKAQEALKEEFLNQILSFTKKNVRRPP